MEEPVEIERPTAGLGFEVDEVTAWWVTCNLCSDSELVYGSTAAQDAEAWQEEHKADAHWTPR